MVQTTTITTAIEEQKVGKYKGKPTLKKRRTRNKITIKIKMIIIIQTAIQPRTKVV